MPLSATDQQYIDSLVEEIDSFFERYEQQQRRDEERREEQRRRDEERREEDRRFWDQEVRPSRPIAGASAADLLPSLN